MCYVTLDAIPLHARVMVVRRINDGLVEDSEHGKI